MWDISACVNLSNTFRSCDSSNLNISPLCLLTEHSGFSIWSESVKLSYEQKIGKPLPSYISELDGPTRQYYNNEESRKAELIPGLLDVRHS